MNVYFESKDAGDLNIKCSCPGRMLVSEIYVVEDVYAYVTDFTNWTSVTNKGTSFIFSDFTLPTNHLITFKLNNMESGAIRISCGDTTHTNSSGYLEWIYAWYQTSLYYRDSSNAEKSIGVGFVSSSRIFKIEYNGTTLQLYDETGVIKRITTYDLLSLTRLLRINSSSVNSIDWIKVKSL